MARFGLRIVFSWVLFWLLISQDINKHLCIYIMLTIKLFYTLTFIINEIRTLKILTNYVIKISIISFPGKIAQ